MTTLRPREDEPSQRDTPVFAEVPEPRTPFGDSLRRLLPGRLDSTPVDLDQLFADLVEVVVWTSQDGGWQEHATFLLGTADDHWLAIGFGDPLATELTRRLRVLPGFDAELLLGLIGERRQRVVTLWRHPAYLRH